ncbi:MAG: cytidylate kinase family protein, partial [Coprobacillus sp.]|nr:cytidylate kinase family protein [Coprobacillus sp.]
VLDYVFIYPCGMGIAGAAWATVTSQIFSFVLVIIFQFTINKDAKITSFKHISPKGDILGAIYKVGWSAIVMQGLLSIMMFGLNLILGTANPDVVDVNTLIGSFGIYYKVMQVALYICFGFQNTIITLLSFNYGLKDKERVKKIIWEGLLISIILMAFITIIFESCAYPIAWLFGFAEGNSEFIDIVTRAIRIGSIGYIFMGVSVTIQGIFQGLRMSVRPLIISLLRFAVLIMPITFAFLYTPDPLSSWWWAFPITELGSVIVSLILLYDVYKKYIKSMPDRQLIDTKHLIITISRQHGTNGREIATKLADRLGVSFYDKELLLQAAEETGLDETYLKEKFGDHSNFTRAMISKEPNQEAIIKEGEIIRRIANTESCVILGRAADYFLEDYQIISIYLWADDDTRINNIMTIYNDSRDEAIKNMNWSDRGRSWYYQFVSGRGWGNPENYDLSLDCSVGVDATVETLYAYIKQRYESYQKEAQLKSIPE